MKQPQARGRARATGKLFLKKKIFLAFCNNILVWNLLCEKEILKKSFLNMFYMRNSLKREVEHEKRKICFLKIFFHIIYFYKKRTKARIWNSKMIIILYLIFLPCMCENTASSGRSSTSSGWRWSWSPGCRTAAPASAPSTGTGRRGCSRTSRPLTGVRFQKGELFFKKMQIFWISWVQAKKVF